MPRVGEELRCAAQKRALGPIRLAYSPW
jgi:hypothetical protein